MRVWQKIGLVDRQMVIGLQEEIVKLNNQNNSILEQNRALLEGIICTQIKNIEKVIDEKIADFKAQFEEELKCVKLLIRETPNVIIDSNKNDYKQVETLILELSKTLEQVKNSLGSTNEFIVRITNNTDEIYTLNKEQINNLEALIADANAISTETSKLKMIDDNIKILRETISDLWTIMKAVWVDSLINEIDSKVLVDLTKSENSVKEAEQNSDKLEEIPQEVNHNKVSTNNGVIFEGEDLLEQAICDKKETIIVKEEMFKKMHDLHNGGVGCFECGNLFWKRRNLADYKVTFSKQRLAEDFVSYKYRIDELNRSIRFTLC